MAPTSLILLAIEVNSGMAQGTLTGNIYFGLILGVILSGSIGMLWDLLVDYLQKSEYDGR